MAAADETASRSKAVRGWAGFAVRLAATCGLLWVALRGIPWDQLGRQLLDADWRWWLAGFTAGLFVQAVAGFRWAALARPVGFDFRRRFFIWRFFEGSFFSLCLPSSIGGDVVKAYRLGDTAARRLLAGCTVVADRLTGLAALGVLAGGALASREWSLGLWATVGVTLALLGAAMLCFWIAATSLDLVLRMLPPGGRLHGFVSSLLPYRREPLLLARAICWGLVVQMGGAASVGLIGRGLGIEQPPEVWFSVVPLVALAMVLPISINGIGLRENALATLLAPFGVAAPQAVALGLLWFLATTLTGLIGGVLFLLDRRAGAGAARDAKPGSAPGGTMATA